MSHHDGARDVITDRPSRPMQQVTAEEAEGHASWLAGFTRREQRRLTFVRWLHSTGRLTDWPEAGASGLAWATGVSR